MHYIVEAGTFQKTEILYSDAIRLAEEILENPTEFLSDGESESELQGKTDPNELIDMRYDSLEEMYYDLD